MVLYILQFGDKSSHRPHSSESRFELLFLLVKTFHPKAPSIFHSAQKPLATSISVLSSSLVMSWFRCFYLSKPYIKAHHLLNSMALRNIWLLETKPTSHSFASYLVKRNVCAVIITVTCTCYKEFHIVANESRIISNNKLFFQT